MIDAVPIDRDPVISKPNPMTLMSWAIDEGPSRIVFPRVRATGIASLQAFGSGLCQLVRARTGIDPVPVVVANLNRAMLKRNREPVPLIRTVSVRAPLPMGEHEAQEAFLGRGMAAHLALASEARTA